MELLSIYFHAMVLTENISFYYIAINIKLIEMRDNDADISRYRHAISKLHSFFRSVKSSNKSQV